MAKRYRCPYCSKLYERQNLARHIADKHGDMIPEGYTPMRIAFNSINYNRLDYCGRCVICGGPTKWDESKGRYDRLCGKKACHDAYVKKFEENMKRTMGVARISQTVDGQEKMLANRKISGRYRFKDGGVRTYTGSYEHETLKFMDQVMECKSEDVMTPGPSMQYEYDGGMHWYISDIYYVPYNLVIEVKDGGDKPNTRNMPDYRARQIAKEEHILKNTDFNYLRLTNKDFSQLLSVMSDLKLQLVEKSYERVVQVNENMYAAASSMMPMGNISNVYITNNLQNNVFAGEDDTTVSHSSRFDTVYYRDADGRLRKEEREGKLGKRKVYKADDSIVWEAVEPILEANVGKFVEEGFVYETLFNKKYYTNDQIMFEPLVEEVISEECWCENLEELARDLALRDDDKRLLGSIDETYMDIDTGKKYTLESGIATPVDENHNIQKYMISYLIEKGVLRNG